MHHAHRWSSEVCTSTRIAEIQKPVLYIFSPTILTTDIVELIIRAAMFIQLIRLFKTLLIKKGKPLPNINLASNFKKLVGFFKKIRNTCKICRCLEPPYKRQTPLPYFSDISESHSLPHVAGMNLYFLI